MRRNEAIARLQRIGSEIAQEMGYTQMVIKEDRSQGIWGERLTDYLEQKYGNCTQEIKWFKEDKPADLVYGDNISFEFRFSSPKLCIDRRKTDGSFASIALSDWNHKAFAEYQEALAALGKEASQKEMEDVDRKHEPLYRNNDFKISEIQVFEGDDRKGMVFLQLLCDKWNSK